MLTLGNITLSFTNPGKGMLTGLAYDKLHFRTEEGEIFAETDVFSIGLFICRIDIYFNEYVHKDKLDEII